jgi:hypothetical protein
VTITPRFIKPQPGNAFATECEARRPQFKVHKGVGAAKNAVNYHSGRKRLDGFRSEHSAHRNIVRVFELVEGAWVFRPDLSWDPSLDHDLVSYDGFANRYLGYDHEAKKSKYEKVPTKFWKWVPK